MAIVSKHVDEQREKDSLKRRAIELYRRLDYMLQKPVDEGGKNVGIFLLCASRALGTCKSIFRVQDQDGR